MVCPRKPSVAEENADETRIEAFMRNRMDILLRFEQAILRPLASLFGLKPEIISVFWDLEGPTIAFNREGALYCNA